MNRGTHGTPETGRDRGGVGRACAPVRRNRLGAPNPPVVAVVDHADPVGALAESRIRQTFQCRR